MLIKELIDSKPLDTYARLHIVNYRKILYGISVTCSVCCDGKGTFSFKHSIPVIQDNQEIIMKEDISGALTASDMWRTGFLNKKHDYSIECQYIEFFIPEDNPLFYDNDVRRSMGLQIIDVEKGPREKFVDIIPSIPTEFRAYANKIENNLSRATNMAADNEKDQAEIERFEEKYLPLIIDMLQVHDYESYTSIKRDEILKTMELLTNGTEQLLDRIQQRGKYESELAQSLIEAELQRDGYIDPYSMNASGKKK